MCIKKYIHICVCLAHLPIFTSKVKFSILWLVWGQRQNCLTSSTWSNRIIPPVLTRGGPYNFPNLQTRCRLSKNKDDTSKHWKLQSTRRGIKDFNSLNPRHATTSFNSSILLNGCSMMFLILAWIELVNQVSLRFKQTAHMKRQAKKYVVLMFFFATGICTLWQWHQVHEETACLITSTIIGIITIADSPTGLWLSGSIFKSWSRDGTSSSGVVTRHLPFLIMQLR